MRRRLPLILLGLAVFLYFFTYGLKSLNNYWGFNMPSFDFAIYDQGLWLLSRFEEPFVTILGLHLFGDHTSFILLPLVPLYWLWPSGALLLIAQALALALGAVPLFLLGRRLLGSEWLALGPAVAYLLTPALGWLNLENFHPDSFEVPLALFAIYFMVVRRWFWFAVAVVFLLAVKEDVALLTAPLGLFVAWRYHRRMGLVTFFGSVVWMLLAIYLIQPYFSGVEAGALDSWRIPFGGPGGVVKTVFTDPSALAAHVFTGEKLLYVLQLLLPTAFLTLASPLALVALPVLGFNLLSTFFYQYHLEYHYHSLIIPVAWAATVFGLARIPWRDVRRGAVVAIMLTAALSAYLWGPLGWSLHPSGVADPESERAAAAREAIAMIPEDAAVSAWYAYASHLTHRAEIYDFPNPWYASYWGDDSQKGQRLARADSVDFVLIPANLGEGPSLEVSQRLTADEGFTAIWEESGLVLYASPEAAGGGGDPSRGDQAGPGG